MRKAWKTYSIEISFFDCHPNLNSQLYDNNKLFYIKNYTLKWITTIPNWPNKKYFVSSYRGRESLTYRPCDVQLSAGPSASTNIWGRHHRNYNETAMAKL